jgi:uncharacterized membrane protein
MPSEPLSMPVQSRIRSIDAMRGLVMLIMLVDHVRERFFLHMQVSDPMSLDSTSTGLFWTRMSAHLCAPTFVFLTGLSAWLYANPMTGARSPAAFLAKRGLFIIALEITLVTFSWMGNYHTVYLQVMWAIGISMLALAVLHRLPYGGLLMLGLLIVGGHNTLTPLHFQPGEWGYSLWTILHDRGYLLTSEQLNIKASYPVLPWIGVILLGYSAGPLFAGNTDARKRQRGLLWLGTGCLLLLLLLRGLNLYGETLDWHPQATWLLTLMDFVNVTKYPPSLDFLLLSLGLMLLLLRAFERCQPFRDSPIEQVLVSFGAAPLFFYLLHLYSLLVIYSLVISVLGANHGELLGVNHIGWIWLIALLLGILLYWPTRWFGRYKRTSLFPWVKYL